MCTLERKKTKKKSQVAGIPTPVKKHKDRGRSLGKWSKRKGEKLKSR